MWMRLTADGISSSALLSRTGPDLPRPRSPDPYTGDRVTASYVTGKSRNDTLSGGQARAVLEEAGGG